MMDATLSLLSLAGAIAIGAMSPGPSFVMVARTAIAASRADGLAAALGMGIGGVVFAAAALLGLHAALATVPLRYAVLKAAGGWYLVYLGFRIWRGARAPLDVETGSGGNAQPRVRRSLALGLTTQLSNPKTAIVYASIFAALLPHDPPRWLGPALLLAVFAIEAGWYALVATVLSSPAPRAAYLRAKAPIDRLAGGVMALLGVRLIATAVE